VFQQKGIFLKMLQSTNSTFLHLVQTQKRGTLPDSASSRQQRGRSFSAEPLWRWEETEVS